MPVERFVIPSVNGYWGCSVIAQFFSLLFVFLFCTVQVAAGEQDLKSINVPKKLRKKLKSFEPSSGIFLPEENKYLVAIDDTTKKDDPWLFFMDENGEVESEPVKIEGLKKMTDMESISQDESGFIYILSSQGLNKSGKEKIERNLFVKAQWNSSHSLEAQEVLELRPILLEALMASRDPILKKMRSQYEELLDIESHFIQNGEVYIGLKEPQFEQSKAVILKLGSVKDVFAGNIDLSLWQVLDLRTDQAERVLLSELAWAADQLWATSTTDEGLGSLWSYDGKRITLEAEFDARSEGLAISEKGAMLLFDQGNDGDGLFLNIH